MRSETRGRKSGLKIGQTLRSHDIESQGIPGIHRPAHGQLKACCCSRVRERQRKPLVASTWRNSRGSTIEYIYILNYIIVLQMVAFLNVASPWRCCIFQNVGKMVGAKSPPRLGSYIYGASTPPFGILLAASQNDHRLNRLLAAQEKECLAGEMLGNCWGSWVPELPLVDPES